MFEANAVLSPIRLYIGIDQNQSANQEGLVFEITLVNESEENNIIRNILDTIQIKLQDEEGWPLKLPVGSPSRILISTPGKTAYPFLINSFKSVNRDIDLIKMLVERELVLQGKNTYVLSLKIDRIQDIAREKYQESTTKTKKLGQGIYTVDVTVDILSQQNIGHRLCATGPIEVKIA